MGNLPHKSEESGDTRRGRFTPNIQSPHGLCRTNEEYEDL